MSDNVGAEEREQALAARERQLATRHADLQAREQRADDRERRADARDEAARHSGTPSPGEVTRALDGDVRPGSLIGERWRIEELIARGGAGTVWRATDLRLQRPVAVKLLRTDLLDDGLAMRRFRREAELLASVEHEHVMRLLDVHVRGHQLCLIAEHVGGMSLRSLMARHAPFSPDVVAALGVQLGTGVAAIHAQGIVHRDLKPRNVVLTERGTLKIVDFGTARHLAGELTPATAGQVAGSPAYLAPEQVEGRLGDQRTDLYALGLILWEAAAGRRPFSGDTSTAIALARLTAEVPELAELTAFPSHPLSAVVHRLTRSDPRTRFRSAWEAVDALAPLVPARPVDLVAAVTEDR
ncbi:serine/threonine-protein kinase [Egicoccus halophilus]|uniref:serine/threonine-protein kinase n=1 Tax=Egicoccus halophilus TaxID=1670830 RepID=UPI0013EE5849|nr:serine/threonine-protein kinase [Egicoccus halophilus]